MTTKNKKGIILISILLLVSTLILPACSFFNGKAKVDTNVPQGTAAPSESSAASPTPESSKEETANPENTSKAAQSEESTQEATEEYEVEDTAAIESPEGNTNGDVTGLLGIFPEKLNTEWRYTDSKAFGYKVRVLKEEKKENGKLIRCVGIFKDSVPESKGIAFNVEYLVNSEGIYEKILKSGNVSWHPIKEMMIIKGKLEKNSQWEQEVQIKDSKEKVKLQAEIFNVLEEEGKKVYHIRYTAQVPGYPKGKYIEERLYKTGVGLVSYSSTDKNGNLFKYTLEKIQEYKAQKK